jgi:HD-like signal output (HDOD) protein
VQTGDLDFTFPTLPSTISRVQEFIASGSTDPAPLIEIVKQDPSVSVNVLRRANSAFYGVRREVDNVDQAVRLLGYVEISSIVLIDGVRELREDFRSHRTLLKRIAHTATFTGRFAQRLVDRLEVPAEMTRVAFAAGFICGMSRLVLLHVAPDRYESLVESGELLLPTAEAEKRGFGESYRTLASQASVQWDLPERISEVLNLVSGSADEAGSPKKTLALVIRAGSDIARRDLEDDAALAESGLEEIQNPALKNLVGVAAQEASTYAAEVGHF